MSARPLRVLVDATSLPTQRVGVGHYLVALMREAPVTGRVELHALVKARDVDEVRDFAPGVRVHPVAFRSRPTRIVWEQALLPFRARRLRPDVFHGPHYTLPFALGLPAVVTFHDPTFFTMPSVHERSKVAYFTRLAKLGVRRATRVIAVSEYARRGAIEHAGADPARVDVVHLGVDLERYTPDASPSDERLRTRLHVKGPYLFWVGAIEPRKDVPAIVDAFARLVAAGADLRLVLAGPRAWGAAAADEAVARSGLADRIVRPGYVSEEEKIALYRGARALVYPSLAEGFGLQVLEAMACGCPVVTTTGSAPEEVAGDAAELVPPSRPGALEDALLRVLSDESRREAMRRRGLERARGFTWSRTAEATIAAYERALLR